MKYMDRNGIIKGGMSGQDRLLAFLYGHMLTRAVIKLFVLPGISQLGGKILDSRLSAVFVEPFVRRNRIDLSQYERRQFRSYNDFFTRTIKKEARQ